MTTNATHAPCAAAAWYRRLYQEDLLREARLSAAAAPQRVRAIELLIGRNRVAVRRLAELGCGPGDVILGCRARGIGEEFFAVDYSEEAIAYLCSRVPDIKGFVADITEVDFRLPRPVDLAVLSHVLEHLDKPLPLLRSLAAAPVRHLLLEVPLENLPLYRIKCALFGRNNRVGHVQFFTRRTFRNLVKASGLEIIDEFRYTPVHSPEALRLTWSVEGTSTPVRLLQRCSRRWLPLVLGRLWSRLYYSHYAVLCRSPLPA